VSPAPQVSPAASIEVGAAGGALLGPVSEAIRGGKAATVDLAGVAASDSAGLALLIEWLSVAKAAAHPLHYQHVPPQLQQLARLSEVEDLLLGA
jgi:phospholipid transport system transporter-binding protein